MTMKAKYLSRDEIQAHISKRVNGDAQLIYYGPSHADYFIICPAVFDAEYMKTLVGTEAIDQLLRLAVLKMPIVKEELAAVREALATCQSELKQYKEIIQSLGKLKDML